MAQFSDEQIRAYVEANIGNPAAIAEAAATAGVSIADLSRATGFSAADVSGYFNNANVEPPPAQTAPTQTYSSTDEQGNPIYDYVAPPPAVVTPPPAAQTAAKTTATTTAKPSAVDTITKQILAQNLSSKWSGEGQGSAEANARDMAKIIADTGATSIKDFGKITKTGIETAVQPDGQGGFVDQNGKPVDPKLVKTDTVYSGGDSGTAETVYTAPVGTKEVFGNKKTGQEVGNTYAERQQGDFFGGTFSGKGNTGYGVKFDAKGNPIFYTAGATSNDFAQLMQDLGPIGNIALAAIGGPAAVAAMGVLSGKPPEDILKSAALSYLGGQAGSFVSGAEGITDLLGETGTKIAANAAKQFVGSGGKNIDPLKLLAGSGAIDSFFGNSGVDGPSSADFEEGYFSPGGEGFNVLNSQGTDEFLQSIGINSVDELTDSGLSNADILSLVNGDFGNLTGLDGLVSVDDDFPSTYVDSTGGNLPSVDEDFPSTYTDITDDEIYSILNSGNVGNITSLIQSLTGGSSGTGGTRSDKNGTTTTTGGTGTTTTTGGTGTTTGGTGTTTGGTGTTTGGTTGGTTTGTTTTGGTTTGGTKTTTGGTKTTTGGTKTTTGGTKTTGGTNVAKALAGLVTGAKTAGTGAKTALPATAKTAAATSANPVVDAVTGMADQQQNQQTNLLNFMGSGKDQVANIKSYKDLYGQDLFGDNYVPPSALGLEAENEDEYANGGHINDLSVDALLHILRN